MPMRKPISVAVAVAVQSMAAQAQEAPATSGESILEEIVVTASRRGESVLDVPYNITAVTGDQLTALGVSDTSALIRMIPGLSVYDEGPRTSGNRNNLSIRGLNASTLGNEDDNPRIGQATVSTYVGETPVFFPLKLVDLERVEVLRGPQGTLYGSGSVGGTVRYIPRKPDFEAFSLDANIESSFTHEADNLGYEGHVTLNAPMGDTAAFRVSAGYERIPGFIDAVYLTRQTGAPRNPGAVILENPDDILGSLPAIADAEDDVNDAEVTFARASLRFAPNDRVEINLGYHYQESSADSRYEDNPEYGTGGDYKTYKYFTDPQDNKLNLISADVEVDLGFARLTSATGYSEVDVFGVSESSGFLRTNIPQYYFGFPRIISPISRWQSNDTFTQEIRLVSQGDGPLEWVVGGFYLKNDLDFDLHQPMPGINDYTNAYFGLNPPLNFTDLLATGGTYQEFTDLAGFGELSWHITDAWQVTVGARVFSQELDGESGIPLPFASRTIEWFYYGSATNDFLLGGLVPTENDADDAVFKFNTSYAINENTLAFFTYSQGFRSGGANQLPEIDPFGNDNSAILRFDSDDADNFEVGIKGTWNSRVSYTATAFYVDWQDFQTTLFSLFGIAYVDNIGAAESKGVELELNGNLSDRASFSFSYSYIDAETSEAFEQQTGVPETTVESGTALPGAADHQLFASIQYEYPLGDSSLLFHADLAYRDKSNSSFRDQPLMATDNFVPLDDFTVWNASVTWAWENFGIAFFGENLSNERATTIVSSPESFGAKDGGWGVIKPRTVGLRLRWSYE